MTEDDSDKDSSFVPYDHQSLRESVDSRRRRRSSVSELSRIVSGIRDDIHQQSEEYKGQVPDMIIADQLDLVSRKSSRVEDMEKLVGGQGAGQGGSGAIGGQSSGHGQGDAKDDGASITSSPDSDTNEDIPPPDKGFAWVIALISMFSVFSTWGSNAGYGVFLDYYMSHGTFAGASMYDYALIGGIVVFLAQGMSPFTTLMVRVFGIRIVILTGIILQTAGYILASFATKLWQLYLTQGLIVGLSFSFVYLPATLVLPTWFDKNRALAFGICVSGAGLGGLTFALSVNKVISISGNQQWGLRLSALLALITALPCFFLRPRYHTYLPPSKRFTKQFVMDNVKLIFDGRIIKSLPIMVLGLWFGIALLGYVVMLFSIAPYATLVGLSASQGSTLTALLNAGQVIGRPLLGLIADRLGRSTTAGGAGLIIAILLWAFWINAKTFGALIPFSLIIGAIVGIGSTMCQPICSDLIEDQSMLAAGWSTLNIIVSIFCLVAEVIALALKQDGTPAPFLHTQIFAGSCFFGCFLLMLVIREMVVRKTLKGRLAASLGRIELLKPGRYLTVTDLDKVEAEKEEMELLEERVERHEFLLRGGVVGYFIRMFYPIKV